MTRPGKGRLCLIGAFPPPLCGMSLINDYIRTRLEEVGADYVVLNISPDKLGRSVVSRIKRLGRIIYVLLQFSGLLVSARVGKVYLGLSGGWGQFYDALFLMLARIANRQVYIHHHSYAYLDKPWLLTRWAMFVSGRKTVHIVACDKMKQDLLRCYPGASRTTVISGIAALDISPLAHPQKKALATIGFLSNITEEKGIFEFIKVAIRLKSMGFDIKALIAGPFESYGIRDRVMSEISGFPHISYVGPKYGKEKTQFFDQIDVFLFPTKNESEGLVIHEAMSRGVPVVAFSRGCIDKIITDTTGRVILPSCDFVEEASKVIGGWCSSGESFIQVHRDAGRRFAQLKKDANQTAVEFITVLSR